MASRPDEQQLLLALGHAELVVLLLGFLHSGHDEIWLIVNGVVIPNFGSAKCILPAIVHFQR